MNILIVEDESLAAERLQNLLITIDKNFVIMGVMDSVKSSVNYLKNFPAPDLIFMDIMLADGTSFEIFEQINFRTPIIFTTAYDEFALQAFRVNSVDYLLKPIELLLLDRALKKFNSHKIDFDRLKSFFQSLIIPEKKVYKKRFLVKSGEKFTSIPTDEIAYFSYEDKLTFLYTVTGKRSMLDYSLDEIVTMVDPKQFFRLNRQYLSSFIAITSIHGYFNSKLKVQLTPDVATEVIISKERAAILKVWLDH